MNSTSGSAKQMTAKNTKTSSSHAMSSAESKKIWLKTTLGSPKDAIEVINH